jgi:hypothetical protein
VLLSIVARVACDGRNRALVAKCAPDGFRESLARSARIGPHSLASVGRILSRFLGNACSPPPSPVLWHDFIESGQWATVLGDGVAYHADAQGSAIASA